jgi:hypothetical protein
VFISLKGKFAQVSINEILACTEILLGSAAVQIYPLVLWQLMFRVTSASLSSFLSIYECRYDNLAQDLHRVDVLKLSQDEKLAFFLNLHNAMVIHAVIRVGCPEGAIDRRSFYSDFQYIVGGSPYSLNTIKNGILRSNRRSPYSLVKPFGTGDKRLEVKISAEVGYIC